MTGLKLRLELGYISPLSDLVLASIEFLALASFQTLILASLNGPSSLICFASFEFTSRLANLELSLQGLADFTGSSALDGGRRCFSECALGKFSILSRGTFVVVVIHPTREAASHIPIVERCVNSAAGLHDGYRYDISAENLRYRWHDITGVHLERDGSTH